VRVAALWRYPVKSMQGERLDRTAVAAAGFVGDRRFALLDAETGLGLTGRREPRLLQAFAALGDDGVTITLPDGTQTSDDATLSDWLGRAVRLADARTTSGATYECPVDDDDSDWFSYDGPGTAFHDAGFWRVSLVSTATIGAWDARRFRANVVLDGEGEDELEGAEIDVGSTRLRVTSRIPRCVMVTRPQPDGIDADLSVLRTIQRERDNCLAIGATVSETGEIAVGDTLARA
jgi:uncharacterized protein YcbX